MWPHECPWNNGIWNIGHNVQKHSGIVTWIDWISRAFLYTEKQMIIRDETLFRALHDAQALFKYGEPRALTFQQVDRQPTGLA